MRAVASASRMPSRRGSANPMSARISVGPSPSRRARPTVRSPVAAEPSIRTSHAVCVVRDPPDSARTASGAPMRSVSTRPSRRARVRANGRASETGSASRSSAGSRRAAHPSSSTARISERVNELGGEPPPIAQASSSARSASSRIADRSSASSTGPAGVRTEATSSRLRVSVPVLSVMIRSTAPRDSSALSRRTSTPRLRRR